MAKANNTSIASALSIDAWEMGNVTSSGTPEFSQLHLSKEQNQGSPARASWSPCTERACSDGAYTPDITEWNNEIVDYRE